MFNLFGINFHLYGLLIGVGIWCGFEAGLRTYPKLKKEMEEVFWWALATGLVGARLYHVVHYWERYYQTNLDKIPAVWDGGLGIWGGMIGAILGLGIYSWYRRKYFLPLLDAFTVGAPLAQAIGRLGNFVNGELTGKNGEPLFAYEATLNMILFGILWIEAKKNPKPGIVAGFYLAGYGLVRVILEGLRPADVIWMVAEVPVAIIFGLLAILFGVAVVWMVRKTRS